MRQTLLRVPLDAPWSIGSFEVPGFGFGIVLALWAAVAAWWLWRYRRDLRLGPELFVPAGLWLAIAAGIVSLPSIVQRESTNVIRVTTAAIEAGAPSLPAYLARARARQERREYSAAVEDLRAAIRIDEKSVDAHRDLAWILATCPDDSIRNGRKALDEAQKAGELSGPHDGVTLDILGAAAAEAGDFPMALAVARRGAVLAGETSDAAVAVRLPHMRERLARYERNLPWREPKAGKAIPIYGYGFMLFLGFCAAGWAASRRARGVGVPVDMIWDVGLWGFFAGIAGARLFYVLQYPDRVFVGREGFGKVVALFNLPDGGLVLYGGVILGVLAVIVGCRRRKLSVQLVGDILVPSLFLGLAFGRMGCFLNGCCYGDRCELAWCVAFPAGSVPDTALVTRGFQPADDVLHRILLHPTQIYSAIDGLALAFLTASYFRYRHRDGAVMLLGLLCYPVTRFLIEFLRSDEPPVLFSVRAFLFWGREVTQLQTPFTISQWVSVGLLAGGLAYLAWWNRHKPPVRFETATGATAPAAG